jgi:non-ribosomal peptide synthase protein (TIGR01720 family)
VGELYVAGPGVARGYRDRPVLTAERFVPDPFGDEEGARLYRTGDLARWRNGGVLEFLGRIDDQVKVRGHRVELGEVEATLARHPALRDVVVVAREDVPGEVRLVAYLVLDPTRCSEPAQTDWRHWLRQRLPEAMVPSAFVFLDQLPRAPNSKIDRLALPAPARAHTAPGHGYVAPRDALEERLAEIASQVLRCDRVGVYDNLFDLGIDSILGIQIASRARQAGLTVNPALVFQYPTLAELAARTAVDLPVVAEQGPVSGPVPLTPIQHWFFAQELPEPHHCNQALLLQVEPTPDADRTSLVVKHLVAHHDGLRLRFTPTESGWSQEAVAEDASNPFVRFDLSALPEADQAVAIEALAAELEQSLNLTEGPLLRVALFELGTGRPGRLLVLVHQLVVDGTSWRTLLDDLLTLDRHLARGEPARLPPKTTSFRQWAERLNASIDESALEDEASYWLGGNIPAAASFPLDFGDDPDPGHWAEAASLTVTLGEAETLALVQEATEAYNTEVDDLLLTALAQTLAAWTDEDSVQLDVEWPARKQVQGGIDVSRTIGWFTSLFPIALRLEPDAEPGPALKSIKEQLRAVPRRGIAPGLIRFLRPDSALAQQFRGLPRSEVCFAYRGRIDQAISFPSGWTLARESAGPRRARSGKRAYLLQIEGQVVGDQLRLQWIYNPHRHRRSTVEALAERFLAVLEVLIAHCLSPEARGYTPSDFPLADLDQRALDQLVLLIEEGAEEGLDR